VPLVLADEVSVGVLSTKRKARAMEAVAQRPLLQQRVPQLSIDVAAQPGQRSALML